MLSALFTGACVIDAWRYLHPLVSAFSWTKFDGSVASRIDLNRCPFSWVHGVLSCKMLPCPVSDHSAVHLEISIPEPIPRGQVVSVLIFLFLRSLTSSLLSRSFSLAGGCARGPLRPFRSGGMSGRAA